MSVTMGGIVKALCRGDDSDSRNGNRFVGRNSIETKAS